MKCLWISCLLIVTFSLPLTVHAQAVAPPSNCPVSFVKFNPSGLSIRVKNESGKKIVGMNFYAALADATEHWKWLHWDFDVTRPLREFGWTKEVKPGAVKTLSWQASNLNFEYGGGGAFVLTSVLFEDGSSWEEPSNRASCAEYWYNNHKKGLTKHPDLPIRQ
jgi:hypothetical protein